jgi:predicted ATPase
LASIDRDDLVEVLDEADMQRERCPARASPGTETADRIELVGRESELDTLDGWVYDLMAGRGRATWIEGEPGIGRTSLAQVAAARAESAGCRVSWASCDELSGAIPLLPWLDALDRPDTRADLATTAARIVGIVDELLAATPVILVLDDLQWADPASLAVAARLVRSAGHKPLLLMGLSRSVPRHEKLSALRRLIQPADRVVLGGLSDTEATDYLARITGGRPGANLLRLAAGAAGNPRYLTDLVDALERDGSMLRQHGRVEACAATLPDSVATAIRERLGFLSNRLRGLLESAALLGAEFSVSDLALVSGRHVGELASTIDEAIRAGVLYDNGRSIAFRHALIHSALHNGIPASVRAAHHRAAHTAKCPPRAASGNLRTTSYRPQFARQ